MAQASNNQMYLLQWLGIELPKPHTVGHVTWKVKRKWSEAIVRLIIDYVSWGNGAGPGDHAWERLAFYQMARRLYEGRQVVKIGGKSDTQYLVLQIYPKTKERVLWEAQEYGIEPREVDPFWCDFVPRGEPPDYEGHIRGGADISDYRVAEKAEEAITAKGDKPRQPKRIAGDFFPLVMTQDTLIAVIRGFAEGQLFRDGDCLPLPGDVAIIQKLRHRQYDLERPGSVKGFKPLTEAAVAEVYRQSHYVRQEGRRFVIVERDIVVCI